MQPSYISSANYESKILYSVLSPAVVDSIVYQQDFQRTSGADISVNLNASNIALFKLEARDSNQQKAQEGLERAKEFLTIKLRALAISEINASISYIKELEKEAQMQAPTTEANSSSAKKPTAYLEPLKEQQEALVQKAEVLKNNAILIALSQPQTKLSYPLGYWLYYGLWITSMCSLIVALKLRPIWFKAIKPAPKKPAPEVQTIALGRPIHTGKLEPPSPDLINIIKRDIGEIPTGILVLGEQGVTRCPLSMRLCRELEGVGHKVHLIDFDLEQQTMTRQLGEIGSPGVSNLLTHAGRAEEFFASLPGLGIEFAPAGTLKVVPEMLAEKNLAGLLYPNRDDSSPNNKLVTVIDASFTSPLQLAIPYVQTVFCLFRRGQKWNPIQTEVLDSIRCTRLPIWGVSEDDAAVVRFL